MSGLSAVTAISAGNRDSVALLSSGSVMTWGINKTGTLGNGTVGEGSDVPVMVTGLSKAASISAGAFHMLAFGEPIPAISSVSPSVGPGAGGTRSPSRESTSGGDRRSVRGAEATNVTVNSATSITATVPAGTGTVDVRVTTPAGTSPTGPADKYTYTFLPTVTKLSAKGGPAAGGTTVVITGTEFSTATKVSFGETEAPLFTINSPTTITVTSPATVAGTVDVTVTNSAGTSLPTKKDHFKLTPSVTGVSPASGSIAGATSVTVTGSGFSPGGETVFTFGKGKATSVNCASSTSCTMLTPAHAAGTVDVKATHAKAKSPVNAPADQFSFDRPSPPGPA